MKGKEEEHSLKPWISAFDTILNEKLMPTWDRGMERMFNSGFHLLPYSFIGFPYIKDTKKINCKFYTYWSHR